MFILNATKNNLTLEKRERITSGSVNVYQVRFQFSLEWDGLDRTAVFRSGADTYSVFLDSSGACVIPWEVLTSHGRQLTAGVYGTRDNEIVLPTIWVSLGTILEGAAPGKESRPPTPELWEQALNSKGDNLAYTDTGELGLYSGDKLLSSVPVAGGEGGGEKGDPGTTFIPSVSEAGILSWSNDGGLPNPEPVDIIGPPGKQGDPGEGVPPGGTTGQMLTKASDGDFETRWADPPAGGGFSAFLINAPIGVVVAWSGTEDNVPKGWSICNGENGTFDLQDKFLLGAGPNHAVGETGGEEEVKITASAMPRHTHSLNYQSTETKPTSAEYFTISKKQGTTYSISVFSTAGEGQPHNNMPPYYTLLYIQKTSATPTDYMTAEEVMAAIQEAMSNIPASGGVPINTITIWSGAVEDIPAGWALCDGQDGRPDLRGRFVLGAGGTYNPGAAGGSEEVTLTVGQMPQHNHEVSFRRSSEKAMSSNNGNLTGTEPVVASTKVTGSSQPHPNMPPYYALCYIIKVSADETDGVTMEQVHDAIQQAIEAIPPGSNIPAGGVIIWTGAADAVPDGWALCDGTNGTPDLSGRFVLGSSATHAVGETGGSEEVTLTVEQMPGHSHGINVYKTPTSGTNKINALPYNPVAGIQNLATREAGGSQPHPNMPPYYALAYIMRL